MNHAKSCPICSIVIVSYNVAELLLACIESIHTSAATIDPSLAIEIIVVDSASTDDTVARVSSIYPGVTMIACQENVGFTRGTNLGIHASRGELVFLLNPDTVLLGAALPDLIAFMEENPDVGIAGPHTFNTDMTTQSTRRRFPKRLTAFFESTWLQGYAPRRILDHFYVNDVPADQTQDVEWMQGSALMVRRSVFEQVGYLDEAYRMYSEELDFCKRASDAGWRIVYNADAHIIHYGGASSDQVGALKHIYFQTSKIRYHRKVHGAAFAHLLRIFLLASYLSQIALEAIKGMLGSKRPLRQQRVRAYWQVIRSGLRVNL
ncbi:glycosyltransferase family 2 protein [Aggregatilineales bacterium SYSU G02658]